MYNHARDELTSVYSLSRHEILKYCTYNYFMSDGVNTHVFVAWPERIQLFVYTPHK